MKQTLGKRRSRLEIVKDMLEVVKDAEAVSKTDIVYGANLNFSRADKYLSILINKGLLSRNGESRSRYHLTDKGVSFLNQAEELLQVI
ncbi:MAG: winged helix-turn-helix domain-containing protein [Candidatus Bathyarchaeia archaeon]